MDLSQLTPQQKQAVLLRAQQEANQQIYQKMMADMLENCFQKCTGISGDRLESKEQSCLAMCQDRYFDVREQVQVALQKRQDSNF